MPKSDEKLKPCPFCGGKAAILNTYERYKNKDASNYPTGTIIGCTHCLIQTTWRDGYYDQDGTGYKIRADEWNRRTP